MLMKLNTEYVLSDVQFSSKDSVGLVSELMLAETVDGDFVLGYWRKIENFGNTYLMFEGSAHGCFVADEDGEELENIPYHYNGPEIECIRALYPPSQLNSYRRV